MSRVAVRRELVQWARERAGLAVDHLTASFPRLADWESGEVRPTFRPWREAVRLLREAIESLGMMAVINNIVGNNTSRVLSVDEFRGFALSDEYAPLIFVNGANAKSAQMFTLAPELAHVWLAKWGRGYRASRASSLTAAK